MSFELPREYIVYKFFQLGADAKYNKFNDTYQCGCPICNEGSSLGRKQRCYYIPSNNNIYCHNCGWSSIPLNWIKETTGRQTSDILSESRQFDINVEEYLTQREKADKLESLVTPSLPKDCINLFDNNQVNFFKENRIVGIAVNEIKRRRLDTAVNRPNALYVSLNDKVHKNRLIIPFYENKEIVFYQSRSLTINDSLPKYISKINSTKSLYGFDQISSDLDHIFLFEGPINSFFVRNGVAVAGIQENARYSFTHKQTEQLSALPLYKKIWVLDSQWIDNASMSKSKILADQGETIFIWPEKLGKKYKDFNDIAIKFKLDEISDKFIRDNSYTGVGAKIALEAIQRL